MAPAGCSPHYMRKSDEMNNMMTTMLLKGILNLLFKPSSVPGPFTTDFGHKPPVCVPPIPVHPMRALNCSMYLLIIIPFTGVSREICFLNLDFRKLDP